MCTRTSDSINWLIERFVGILGILMATVMGVQVVARYVFNHSLFWSEEVGRILLVWLTFLGSTIAYKRKLHVGVDFLVRKLSPFGRRLCFIITVFASLIFFGTLVILGTKFLFVASMYKTAALGIPGNLIYAVIPFSGLVFIIHALNILIEALHRW
ncbi:MAG: TRAP transporter small permease [Syntrophobacterales bacterium]|nr:TRAP transporter small permease [Syntrophobacterales bacterium]